MTQNDEPLEYYWMDCTSTYVFTIDTTFYMVNYYCDFTYYMVDMLYIAYPM